MSEKNRRSRLLRTAQATILAGIVALFLVGCGTSSEAVAAGTPTATSRFPTVLPRGERATLPPSWTPTLTPTYTSTPTITPTPTATPTLTIEEICAGFSGAFYVVEGGTYYPSDEIPLFASLDSLDAIIVLSVTHMDSGEVRSMALPGGQTYLGQYPLASRAGPGRYEWSLSVAVSEQIGLCERKGTFMLAEEPEATAEAASQTPVIIIVTATPEPESTRDNN